MEVIRKEVENRILELTGMAHKGTDSEYPKKEPRLFDSQCAICQVHFDFPVMMCGGISALLLQMLHPSALAGILDHSNFREDIFGRLRRTCQFIFTTTFGTARDAERLITRIKFIHDRVKGTGPDGLVYTANDPDLLTWVHVAECSSFMASYLRYQRTIFSHERQVQYYRETASIAAKLGARNIPTTPEDIADYLQDKRSQLRYDDNTREVAQVLLTAKPPGFLGHQVGRIMTNAGVDLLPCWAQEMIGLRMGIVQRSITRTSAYMVGKGLRACISNPEHYTRQGMNRPSH